MPLLRGAWSLLLLPPSLCSRVSDAAELAAMRFRSARLAFPRSVLSALRRELMAAVTLPRISVEFPCVFAFFYSCVSRAIRDASECSVRGRWIDPMGTREASPSPRHRS